MMYDFQDLPIDSGAPANHGRRGGRVSCRLWVRVVGWDQQPVSRPGDLAATGVFISTSEPWGSPNDVVLLELESIDRAAKLKTMARVARVIRQDDRRFGARVIGVALEFLPLETIQNAAASLVRRAVAQELTHHGHVRLDVPARSYLTDANDGAPQAALLQGIGLEQLTLLTASRVEYGKQVNVEVPHADTCVRLGGRIVSSQPLPGGLEYSTLVHLEGPLEGRAATLLDMAHQLVIPDDYEPPPDSGFDFSGELGSVGIDEVLELVSHRCYSGVLSISNELQCFSVQVSQGSITSVEGNAAKTQEDAVAQLKDLRAGEFRFRNKRRPQLTLVSTNTTRLVADILSQPPGAQPPVSP
jgi:hypothetical protein